MSEEALEISAGVLLHFEIQAAACRCYAQSENLRPTPDDFADWLTELPEQRRIICALAGFQVALLDISFSHYVLEQHGFSLYEYVHAYAPVGSSVGVLATRPAIWVGVLNSIPTALYRPNLQVNCPLKCLPEKRKKPSCIRKASSCSGDES